MLFSYKTQVLIISAMLLGALSSVSVAFSKGKSAKDNTLTALKSESAAKSDANNRFERKKIYFFTEAVRQKEAGNYAAAIDLLTEC